MKWGINLIKVGNIMLLLLTVLAWFAPYEVVQQTMIIPILGLTYPAFILAHGAFVIFWSLFRSRWAFLSILLLGIGFIWHPQVLNVGLSGSTDDEGGIRIATFNAQFLLGNQHNDFEQSTVRELQDIDILCLQECNEVTKVIILESMDFPYTLSDSITTVMILSKYPILATGQVGQPSNPVNAIKWADIRIKSDTIRVYNAHMESNRVNGQIPQTVVTNVEEKINLGAYVGILKHYSKFSKYRIRQAREIRSHITDHVSYPVIICGDMNDSPMSNMYKILSYGLQDTWAAGKAGFRKTFDTWVPGMRIDHIFATPEWSVSDYSVSPVSVSDHHIVSTVVKLK